MRSILGNGAARISYCLAAPGSGSKWGLRVTAILFHLVFVGALFLMDDDFFMKKLRDDPWYSTAYLVLFVVTIVQYFVTSCSSPGYVVDAMKAVNGVQATFINVSDLPKQSFPGLMSIKSQVSSSWSRLVMELYPPGISPRNWSCPYCHIIQPPRSKHCQECDGCVLQFDHHCAWLGTCIGQGNHCRFWWYIFEETVLCAWTGTLYITFLRLDTKAWWKDFIGIVLFSALVFCFIFVVLLLLFHSYLLLTNQTTYEIIRRRRILYLRGIPDRAHPFSKGICRNLYTLCCSRDCMHTLDAVPSMEDLEDRARPYTCYDTVTCRCC